MPVLNSQSYIANCIDHILAEMTPEDELRVVDNGSTDDTLKILSGYSGLQVLSFPGVSIAFNRNRGAESSSGNLLAFVDSDCLIQPGWRSCVCDVLCDPKTHATGAKYEVPAISTWIERAWYLPRHQGRHQPRYINSGNLIVRREAFEEINGFREDLKTDEDCDLAYRLKQAGFAIVEDPGIRSVHLGNPKGVKDFYRKHKWHATSAFVTLGSQGIELSSILTIAFALSILFTLAVLPLVISGRLPALLLLALPAVPIAAAIHRSIRFRSARHLVELVFLYMVYLAARAHAGVSHYITRVAGDRRSSREVQRTAGKT